MRCSNHTETDQTVSYTTNNAWKFELCKLPSVPSKKPNRNTGNLSHTLEPILDTPCAHKTQFRIRFLLIPNGYYVYTVSMCMYMYIQSMLTCHVIATTVFIRKYWNHSCMAQVSKHNNILATSSIHRNLKCLTTIYAYTTSIYIINNPVICVHNVCHLIIIIHSNDLFK